MIKAISVENRVKLGLNNSIKDNKNQSNAVRNNTDLYTKEYSASCENTALASINMAKTQQVSFRGQKLDKLPEDWFFDLDKLMIKSNYGYDVNLDKVPQSVRAEEKQKMLINAALFKGFISNGTEKYISFYRYMPSNNMYCPAGCFMSDGYVKISKDGEIEYISGSECKE